MSEFYIGYLPKAPERLRHFVFRVVLALGALAIVAALVFTAAQQPFAASLFEYGVDRPYIGTLIERPYPVLLTGAAPFLLTAPGKHGAEDFVRELNGQQVQLSGSLIRRGENQMLQLEPGSIRPTGKGAADAGLEHLGAVTLAGEIVDSKCYLGVMNPGDGKVHRDCAVRCISGGIPPALVVRDAGGATRVIVLAGSDRVPLSRDWLRHVAEPVQVSGELVRKNGVLMLFTAKDN